MKEITEDKISIAGKSYSIAKVLVIIGTVLGIHPFAIFFSLPLYGIGISLILFERNLARNLKIKWVTYPLLFICIIWILVILFSNL